ncbi:MAG: biotin synthase, partial [Gammaproteobacteria bacterium]|nr:biotin synthase [Gammaproteobacteria bacterium]
MQSLSADKRTLRHDWDENEICTLLQAPLPDLIFQAQSRCRAFFDPNEVQLSTLLNIKTGGCPEDCAYCPQSARYHTGVAATPLLDGAVVRRAAEQARSQGATRFCMGAAWRSPKDSDIEKVIGLIRVVKELGMETCATLGMLTAEQAQRLHLAGLDFYNHNLDSS